MNSICNELVLFGRIAVADAAGAAAKVAEVPLYRNIYVLLAATVLALLVSAYVGYLVSKAMRDNDYMWRGMLIAASLLVSCVIIVGNWPPRLGVDLKGGTTFIAQIQPSDDGTLVKVEDVVKQLKSRIDPSGVYEIVLRPLGRDKVEIIIPDVNNEEAERIWQRVIQTGFLEFLIVSDNQFRPHQNAQNLAREQALAPLPDQRKSEVYEVVQSESKGRLKGDVVARWVELGRVQSKTEEVKQVASVVPYKMAPHRNTLIRDQRTGAIIEWDDAFRNGLALFSVANADDRGRELATWAQSQGYDQLEILMMYSPDREPSPQDTYGHTNVTGAHVRNTAMDNDSLGRPSVSFNMTSEGGGYMGRLTGKNRPDTDTDPPLKKQLGIVLDNKLLSSPTINGTIRSNGVIEGDFTQEEVSDLVAILKAGKLKAAIAPTPVAQDKVESSIGREMKERGLFAISISFVAVLIFMMIYYRFAGIVACMALLANMVLIVALIMSIRFPFSLTGLAGLVLTVGMSVDANVLIFERMREEIEKGATLRMAIRNGFAKATTTIVDANLTTLITAIILYVIGSEQIKGFAVSLILGILMSMFTAIFCSRVIFDLAERKRWITKLSMMKFVGKTRFDFINMRTVCGFASVALIAVGLCALFARGSNILAHDMAGGTTARVVFANAPEGGVEYVRSKLIAEVDKRYPEENHEIEVAQVEAWDEQDGIKPGTIFKVNTDLKLEDDTRQVVTELCTSAFPNELSTRGMQYTSSGSGGKTEAPAGNPRTEDPATEEPVDEVEADEVETDDAEAGDDTEEESGCTVQDDEEADDADDTAAAEETDGETAEAASDETATGSEADADTPAEDESTVRGWTPYETVADLTFNFPIGAEGVANTLIESTDGDVRPEVDPRNFEAEGFDGQDLTYAAKKWKVRFQTNSAEESEQVLSAAKAQLDGKPYFQSLSGVGGAIAGETQLQALFAILASLIGIVAYIWIRFQRLSFGLAAVVALIHDVLVVLGCIAISKWLNIIPGIDEFKISLPVIAAFMTIIGYSLNDTIVVFDRIRETRGKNPDLTKEMINRSIGQTLSRTLLTSVTTFLVVFILFAIGGETIHGFAFALVIGVIVGTYSSIFVASPVLYWLMGRVGDDPKPAIAKPGQ